AFCILALSTLPVSTVFLQSVELCQQAGADLGGRAPHTKATLPCEWLWPRRGRSSDSSSGSRTVRRGHRGRLPPESRHPTFTFRVTRQRVLVNSVCAAAQPPARPMRR